MKRINTDEIEFGDDYIYRFEGRPFSGIGYELNDSGKLWSEITFVDGLQSGLTAEWTPDGQLKCEHMYRDGTRHGMQREWHNGVLISEEQFELGIFLNRKTFDKSGKLIDEFSLDASDPRYETLRLIRESVTRTK